MDGIGAYVGELAALGTAFSWAASSLFFSSASRQRSAPLLNLVRIVSATVVLLLAVLITGVGSSMPRGQMIAILASGVVGLALGDAAFFRGLRILGPRRAMLMMATWPAVSALLMVPLLDETLGWAGVTGMVITIGGVVYVQTERDDGTEVLGRLSEGVFWVALGVAGQAVGWVLGKVGLGAAAPGAWLASAFDVVAAPGAATAGEPVDALYATLLRMTAAAVVLVGPTLLGRPPAGLRAALADVRFLATTWGGVALGPVIGVWLSLVAVSSTNTAVAGTIVASSPVLVIPMMRVVHGHRTTWRAWIGALIAVAGVTLLSLREHLGG